MYRLYISNRNYSSWSLRPWVLMRMHSIAFEEALVPFGLGPGFAAFSPNGRVPCLLDDGRVVWDSLAIVEYLAERHASVWPADPYARAWARCVSAEMHSGFSALRTYCSMNCGIRVKPRRIPEDLSRDLKRIEEIFEEGLSRFEGPWLGGSTFTATDAFFAPVAFRLRTYSLTLGAPAMDYLGRLLALSPMVEWERAAIAEPWRDEVHEQEARLLGAWLEDRRAPA